MKKGHIIKIVCILIFVIFESIFVYRVVNYDKISAKNKSKYVENKISKKETTSKSIQKQAQTENIYDNREDGFVFENHEIYFIKNKYKRKGLTNTNLNENRNWDNAYYYFDNDGRLCEYEGYENTDAGSYFFDTYNNQCINEDSSYKNIKFTKNNNNEDVLTDKNGILYRGGVYTFKDGKGYLVDDNGRLVRDEGFYYISRYDANGKVVRKNDEICYVKDDGHVARSRFLKYNNKIYYAMHSGVLAKNCFVGDKYYFNENCELIDTYLYDDDAEIYESNFDVKQKWMKFIRVSKKCSEINYINYAEDIKNYMSGEIVEDLYHDIFVELEKPIKLSKNNRENIDDDKLIIKNKFINFPHWTDDITIYIDDNGNIVHDDIVELSGKKYVIDKYGKLIVDELINYNKKCDRLGEKVSKILDNKTYYIDKNGILIEDNCVLYNVKYSKDREWNINGYFNEESGYVTISLNNESKKSNKLGIFKIN